MILQVEGLEKFFRDPLTLKKKQVLFNICFELQEGRVVGFLGNNGAGKTTTMKCLLGLLKTDGGQYSFFEGKHKDPRSKIGYLPERPYFYDYLTGLEFLKFYGQLTGGLKRSDVHFRALSLLKKVGLDHAKDRQLRAYSKGMLQRVGFAQAIIHRPKLLILDEPMSGLDPDGRYQMSKMIEEVAANGTTLFLSSHLLDDVERLCDDLVIIDKGRNLFSGKTETLLASKESSYLVHCVVAGKTQAIPVENLVEVKKQLEKISQENGYLLEVTRQRARLEDAFIKLKRSEV